MGKRSQDGIKDITEIFANILGKEPQNKITILLQKSVLSTIPSVSFRGRQMLGAVNLNGQSRVLIQQIHLHASASIKRNLKMDVQAKFSGSFRQCFKSLVKKCFCCATGAGYTLFIR